MPNNSCDEIEKLTAKKIKTVIVKHKENKITSLVNAGDWTKAHSYATQAWFRYGMVYYAT